MCASKRPPCWPAGNNAAAMNKKDRLDINRKQTVWEQFQLIQMEPPERELMPRVPGPVEEGDGEAWAVKQTQDEANAWRWLGAPWLQLRSRTLGEVAGEPEDSRKQVLDFIMGVV